MIINIKNKDIKDNTPLEFTKTEFWDLFLNIRNTKNLTSKEIEVLAEHLAGEPKEYKGNYKKYVEKLEKKGLSLKPKSIPNKVTLQININVT
jgi:hypothetical protein